MYSEINNTKGKLQDILKKMFHRRVKRLLTASEVLFQKYLDILAIFSVLFLFMGVIMSLFQTAPLKVYGIFLGIFSFLYGILHLFFFKKQRQFRFFRYLIIYGVVGIILGILFWVLEPFYYFLLWGGLILVISLGYLFASFYFFRFHDNSFAVLIVSTLMGIVLSVLSFLHPFPHMIIAELLGLLSILFGVLNLSILSLFQKKISEFVGCFD